MSTGTTTPRATPVHVRLDTLPRFPGTALRLLQALSDPDSTFREIIDIVRHDVTVTAGVLRLCNSAYLGLRERIGSIDHAARYLGTARLMQITLAVHCQTLLAPEQRGYGLPPGELWAHALGVAFGAEKLARRTDACAPDLAFTCGLLHDVGKIFLNEQVAERYAEIAAMVRSQRISFHAAERHVLGVTHAEIGALAAERWELPPALVAGIRHHHDPLSTEAAPLVDLVHLADVTCIVVGLGGGDDGLMYEAAPEVLRRRGLVEADLEALAAEVVPQVRAVREAFRGE